MHGAQRKLHFPKSPPPPADPMLISLTWLPLSPTRWCQGSQRPAEPHFSLLHWDSCKSCGLCTTRTKAQSLTLVVSHLWSSLRLTGGLLGMETRVQDLWHSGGSHVFGGCPKQGSRARPVPLLLCLSQPYLGGPDPPATPAPTGRPGGGGRARKQFPHAKELVPSQHALLKPHQPSY